MEEEGTYFFLSSYEGHTGYLVFSSLSLFASCLPAVVSFSTTHSGRHDALLWSLEQRVHGVHLVKLPVLFRSYNSLQCVSGGATNKCIIGKPGMT